MSSIAATPTKQSSSTSSSSANKKKALVWSDDEDEEQKSSAVADKLAKKPAAAPQMTLEAIKAICKSRSDLYENVELNEKLFLNFGGFTEIDNLHHFPDLKSLWLENNLLTSLVPRAGSSATGLNGLSKLRCLYLQNNQLTSLQGIEVLSSLVLLNVSSNALTNLKGISSLENLQILDAHENQIEDVTELKLLKGHKALHTLDLSQNAIAATYPAGVNKEAEEDLPSHERTPPEIMLWLAEIPKLKVVYLKQNPLVDSVEQYRRILSALLPALCFLDDRPVSDVDKSCAVAWKSGGNTKEKSVRQLSQQEKREKEERNMAQWMKQKEERVAQLAKLREEQKSAATSSPSSSLAPPSSSSDPSLGSLVYHHSSAPIPASPYHAEVPSVEYSSWVMKQEKIEQEDKQAAQEKKFSSEQDTSSSKTKDVSADEVKSDPCSPLPTSSYLESDASDDPEIRAMKQMLQQVLVNTQQMKRPGGVTGQYKRSHNIGVSEAALVEEIESEIDEQSKADAIRAGQVNLVAESSRPSTAAVAPTNASTTQPIAPEDDFTSSSTLPPNSYSILSDQSISSIYDSVLPSLPSVSQEKDESEEEDVSDVDSETDEDANGVQEVLPGEELEEQKDGIKSPSSIKSPLKSPNSARSPGSSKKMPKIFGFGQDDSHLINKPFFGSAGGFVDEINPDELVREDHTEWEKHTALATSTATSSTAATTATPGKKKDLTLSELLESRRAARLGSASKGNSKDVLRRPVRAAGSGAPLSDDLAQLVGPSSTATGITAESLLNSFIQSQSSPPPASSSSSNGTKRDDRVAFERAVQAEREQKNELFVAASSALEHKRSTSDSEDDSSDDADEDSVTVDPRAISLEARRQARQQGGR